MKCTSALGERSHYYQLQLPSCCCSRDSWSFGRAAHYAQHSTCNALLLLLILLQMLLKLSVHLAFPPLLFVWLAAKCVLLCLPVLVTLYGDAYAAYNTPAP